MHVPHTPASRCRLIYVYTGGGTLVVLPFYPFQCPPGASPITFGPRAMDKVSKRKAKVSNFYLDAALLRSYLCPTAGPCHVLVLSA